VIARWLAFHSLLNEKKTLKEKENFVKECEKKVDRHKAKLLDSYHFIENHVCKENSGFDFLYSPLVLTEVFNVLFEKYVYDYMQRSYIPLGDIHVVRGEKFPDGTYNEIYTYNEQNYNKLKRFTKVAQDKEDLIKVSGVFISEYGLLSQDAHIIAEAINADCKYFITNDDRILENLKNAKQIKVMRPSSFSSHFSKIKTPQLNSAR